MSIVFGCNSYGIRGPLDTLPGYLNENIERVLLEQRSNYDDQLMKYRLSYYDDNAIIWGPCEVDSYWGDDS